MDRKTAGWSLAALASLLPDVFVLLSGCPNTTAAKVALQECLELPYEQILKLYFPSDPP